MSEQKPNPSDSKTPLNKNWIEDDEEESDEDREIGVEYSQTIVSKPKAQPLGQALSAPVQHDSHRLDQERREEPHHEGEEPEENKRWGAEEGQEQQPEGHQRGQGRGYRKDFEGGERKYPSKPYGDRPRREDRPPRQERPEVDPNTNYQKYYVKDHKFHINVMKNEEPPTDQGYEFKLLLFKEEREQFYEEGALPPVFATQDFDNYIVQLLMDYDVQNPRFQSHRIGDPRDPLNRHKVFFNIKDRENAIKCYSDFSGRRIKIDGAKSVIYLVMPEEIFVKHGDIEAEKYYAEQKKYEEEQALYAQSQALRKTKSQKHESSYDRPYEGEGGDQLEYQKGSRYPKKREYGGEGGDKGPRKYEDRGPRKQGNRRTENDEYGIETSKKVFQELAHGKTERPTFKNKGQFSLSLIFYAIQMFPFQHYLVRRNQEMLSQKSKEFLTILLL